MREIRKGKKNIGSLNEELTQYRRVLLVEDNKTTQDVVSELLEFVGFEVALADNGIEALAIFMERSFDLVLTDLNMPAMDGLSLAGQIKERSPNIPVILITGADRETVLKKLKGALVDSVIFKPFRLEELRRAVREMLMCREQEYIPGVLS
jgi:CheY-like chemotaxis protein